MSFSLGSIYATLKLSTDEFNKNLDNAKNKLGGMRGGIESVDQSLSGLRNSAMIAATAVVGGLTLITKSAIDSAAELEQNRLAFETMLGSAEKAKDLLQDITVFAKKTPFELPDLIKSSKQLLAYGIEQEKIIENMTMLGNITAGVGRDKLPQLILAFGQVKAATKLTGAELRQFSEAGVPLLEALVTQANSAGGKLVTMGGGAKKSAADIAEMNDKLNIARQRLKEASEGGKAKESTLMTLRNTVQNYEQKIAGASTTQQTFTKRVKVTKEEMIDMISEGKVSFEEVQKALSGMTGEGGKFFNLMEKQSKTFGGVMSNIKDTIGITMREIVGITATGDIREGSIFDMLSKSAQQFLEFITTNKDAMTQFVNQVVGNTVGFFQSLIPTLQTFGAWVMENKDTILTFLTGLGIALGSLLIISTITSLILALTNPITLIVIAITALYYAWETNFWGIRDVLMGFYNFLVPFFQGVLMPWIEWFVRVATGFFNNLMLNLSGLWNIIVGIFQIAFAVIGAAVTVFLTLFTGRWDEAWKAIDELNKIAWDGLQRLFNGMVEFLAGIGGQILNLLTSPFEKAWEKIREVTDQIRDRLDFTKRHSPSVIDIINKGVNLANRAYDNLQVPQLITTPSYQGAPSMSGVGGVTINLNGNISSNADALAYGEMIGDTIIKRLQQNVRF